MMLLRWHCFCILTGVAVSEGVSSVSTGTVAGHTVLSHVAHRAGSAGVGHHTRVETGPVPADLLVPALTVGAAARLWWRSYNIVVSCMKTHTFMIGMPLICFVQIF